MICHIFLKENGDSSKSLFSAVLDEILFAFLRKMGAPPETYSLFYSSVRRLYATWNCHKPFLTIVDNEDRKHCFSAILDVLFANSKERAFLIFIVVCA